ncbi:hypothetical protein HPB51_024906 [Rhipicephalus microplus]|uniref:SAM domain-containing protein n=1 Tax=Rhipicephalus microplus TaxID=6941 RepID=A0A9J6DX71_RHIMP|nr:hypothetical protein HPB51_024906 [Rhipicephalus microplus]
MALSVSEMSVRSQLENAERDKLMCKQYSPLDVSLWTNHRVMEWLRTVDLSEYAPNLRGSGVHGAFLIYEDSMTWEVFAAVLSIPGNKTLLRRHLSLQLKQLLGPQIVQRKRALQASPDHVPLSPAAKVKAAKKSPLRWRRAKGADGYLCPFEADTLAEDLSSCDSSVADSSFDDSFSTSCPREKVSAHCGLSMHIVKTGGETLP